VVAAGINTLTVDNRGHGESGGKYDDWTDPNWKEARKPFWVAQRFSAAIHALKSVRALAPEVGESPFSPLVSWWRIC
jgi:hypothetical protein